MFLQLKYSFFANFLQKIDFEQSQFQKVSVALAEFYWFELPSLQVLGENCFRARKGSLNEYFYHWNVHFCWICKQNKFWANTVSEAGRGIR